jgi:hypothetical protein
MARCTHPAAYDLGSVRAVPNGTPCVRANASVHAPIGYVAVRARRLIVSWLGMLARRRRAHPQLAPFRVAATVRPISALESHDNPTPLAQTAPRTGRVYAGNAVGSALHGRDGVRQQRLAIASLVAAHLPQPAASSSMRSTSPLAYSRVQSWGFGEFMSEILAPNPVSRSTDPHRHAQCVSASCLVDQGKDHLTRLQPAVTWPNSRHRSRNPP